MSAHHEPLDLRQIGPLTADRLFKRASEIEQAGSVRVTEEQWQQLRDAEGISGRTLLGYPVVVDGPSKRVEIVPAAEGEHHFTIKVDGRPFLHATPGGTGACWNLGQFDDMTGERETESLHVCDLDEVIGVLEALRGSDAHRAHAAQWEPPVCR